MGFGVLFKWRVSLSLTPFQGQGPRRKRWTHAGSSWFAPTSGLLFPPKASAFQTSSSSFALPLVIFPQHTSRLSACSALVRSELLPSLSPQPHCSPLNLALPLAPFTLFDIPTMVYLHLQKYPYGHLGVLAGRQAGRARRFSESGTAFSRHVAIARAAGAGILLSLEILRYFAQKNEGKILMGVRRGTEQFEPWTQARGRYMSSSVSDLWNHLLPAAKGRRNRSPVIQMLRQVQGTRLSK